MPHSITGLENAIRHVANGRERIEHQREILKRLRGNQLPTAQAEVLLDEMEIAQRIMLEHAEVIRSDIDGLT